MIEVSGKPIRPWSAAMSTGKTAMAVSPTPSAASWTMITEMVPPLRAPVPATTKSSAWA